MLGSWLFLQDVVAAAMGGLLQFHSLCMHGNVNVDVSQLLPRLVHLTGLQSIEFNSCAEVTDGSGVQLAAAVHELAACVLPPLQDYCLRCMLHC